MTFILSLLVLPLSLFAQNPTILPSVDGVCGMQAMDYVLDFRSKVQKKEGLPENVREEVTFHYGKRQVDMDHVVEDFVFVFTGYQNNMELWSHQYEVTMDSWLSGDGQKPSYCFLKGFQFQNEPDPELKPVHPFSQDFN